jgi:hypothetical protein
MIGLVIMTIFVLVRFFKSYISFDKEKNIVVVSLSISNKDKLIKPLYAIKDIYLEEIGRVFQIVLVYKNGNYHENVLSGFGSFTLMRKTMHKIIAKQILKYKALFIDNND